jgi:hypothetical protein
MQRILETKKATAIFSLLDVLCVVATVNPPAQYPNSWARSARPLPRNSHVHLRTVRSGRDWVCPPENRAEGFAVVTWYVRNRSANEGDRVRLPTMNHIMSRPPVTSIPQARRATHDSNDTKHTFLPKHFICGFSYFIRFYVHLLQIM